MKMKLKQRVQSVWTIWNMHWKLTFFVFIVDTMSNTIVFFRVHMYHRIISSNIEIMFVSSPLPMPYGLFCNKSMSFILYILRFCASMEYLLCCLVAMSFVWWLWKCDERIEYTIVGHADVFKIVYTHLKSKAINAIFRYYHLKWHGTA